MPSGFPYRTKGKSDYFMQYFAMQNLTGIAPSSQTTAALISADTVLVSVNPSGGAVKMPSAQAGRIITVTNGGANALALWPYNTTDAFNAGTPGAVLVGGIAANATLILYCGVIGMWWSK